MRWASGSDLVPVSETEGGESQSVSLIERELVSGNGGSVEMGSPGGEFGRAEGSGCQALSCPTWGA